ncbi:MAG: DUF1285 domain-containing protein [Rhodothalassiaceae bacterium]
MVERENKANLRLDELARALADQRYPPVDKWNPDFCGDIDMVIKRDGSWHYMGTPILRPEMVRLFASVLRRDDDGKTYLVTPVEKLGIQVEDAAFLAIELEHKNAGEQAELYLSTQTGDVIRIDAEHPIWTEHDPDTGEDRPYVHVRGGLNALIARPVWYRLVDLAQPEEIDGTRYLGVWSDGDFFPLGPAQ